MAIQQSTSKSIAKNLPFELRISAVSAWIESVPVTHKIETCGLVYSTLLSLNRHTLAPQLRFQILEEFRPLVFLQSKHLESLFIGSSFPLELKDRKIAKLAALFQMELGVGYQLVTNNSAFEEELSNLNQATVIHRALQSISISLLRIAQMYEPPSSRVWGVVKLLFRRAEKNRFLDIAVHDKFSFAGSESTVSQVFNKTVLFAISNPYGYSQLEIQALFNWFEVNAHKVIAGKTTINYQQTCFSLDLEDPHPPRPSSDFTQSKTMLYFDPQPLFPLLVQAGQASANGSIKLSSESLARLIHHLGGSTKTQSRSKEYETELCVGMDNIISTVLANNKKERESAKPPSLEWNFDSQFELTPLDHNESDPRRQMHSRSSIHGHDKIIGEQASRALSSEEIWDATQHRETHSHCIRCEVYESDLTNHVVVEMSHNDLPIGQVIALHNNKKPAHVGIIRWKESTENKNYPLYGIECLASNFTLADIFFDSKKHTNVLVLSEPDTQKNPSSILMAPAKYRSGSQLSVRYHKKTNNFRVEKLLESNPIFCHYSLKAL